MAPRYIIPQAPTATATIVPAEQDNSLLAQVLARGVAREARSPLDGVANIAQALALRGVNDRQAENALTRQSILARALAGNDFATAAQIDPRLALASRSAHGSRATDDGRLALDGFDVERAVAYSQSLRQARADRFPRPAPGYMWLHDNAQVPIRGGPPDVWP